MKKGIFCKGINLNEFYIFHLSKWFLDQAQNSIANCAFSDNCKIYYSKSFYDGHDVGMTF